jgi:hypothetical protein
MKKEPVRRGSFSTATGGRLSVASSVGVSTPHRLGDSSRECSLPAGSRSPTRERQPLAGIPRDLEQAFCHAMRRYNEELSWGEPDDPVIPWGDRYCTFDAVLSAVAQYDGPMPANVAYQLLEIPGMQGRNVGSNSFAAGARCLHALYASRVRVLDAIVQVLPVEAREKHHKRQHPRRAGDGIE